MTFGVRGHRCWTNPRPVEPCQTGVVVHVYRSVRPGSAPHCAMEEPPMGSPIEPHRAPAPRRKRDPKIEAKSEIDGPADHETRARREKHHCRIIIRNIYKR